MGLVSLTMIVYVGLEVASAATGRNPENKSGTDELTLLIGTQG